jgi:hypothetical protein
LFYWQLESVGIQIKKKHNWGSLEAVHSLNPLVLNLLIGDERCTRCSSPATLIFRSSHSFITLSSSALYFLSLVHYIISPTSITLSITSGMFFFVFKFYLLQKRLDILTINCSDMLQSTVNSPMWHKAYFKKYKWCK